MYEGSLVGCDCHVWGESGWDMIVMGEGVGCDSRMWEGEWALTAMNEERRWALNAMCEEW